MNKLISWVTERSKRWMSHCPCVNNFTYWAWAIRDMTNNNMFWVIPDPGNQQRVTWSKKSLSSMSFQAGASYVMIPEWGQHSSNQVIPCLIVVCSIFFKTGDQPNANTDTFIMILVCNISDFANCVIEWTGILIEWKNGHVGFVRHTHDLYNHLTGSKLILSIPPPIINMHFTWYLVTSWVSEVHWIKIEACLIWEIYYENQYMFEIIHVV